MNAAWLACLVWSVACLALEQAAMGNAGERDAIHEVAFRYMFEHNAAGQPPTAPVYCIEVGSRGQEANPSKSFIERFRDRAPQVVSRSACTILDLATDVRHDATSASALGVAQNAARRRRRHAAGHPDAIDAMVVAAA
jgi:hypothetical protein